MNPLEPLSVEACRRRRAHHLAEAIEHLSDAEIWKGLEEAALECLIRRELVVK